MRKWSVVFLLVFTSFTQEQKPEMPPLVFPKEDIVETKHSAVIGGETLSYTARTGFLPLKDKANIFFVSYTKNEDDAKTPRPVTFCFNGGPGSSAVWLHMGILGPERVVLSPDGKVSPPYSFKNNNESILDLTDLVFIDPVSTGFSRTVHGEDPKQFHGVDEDISSVAEFIRYYTSRYKRWDSPKYLIGESYGTTRAAGLALKLHDEEYCYLNGIILISSVLNFQTISDMKKGNDLPYLLFLPTYTATAWYHKKLEPSLQEDLQGALKEAEEFAMNDYGKALLKGDAISQEEKESIIEKLSRLTSLSPEYLDRANLRVAPAKFAKEILRDDRRTVGRFDSRYIGIDSNHCGEVFEYDPSAEAIFGAFGATLNQYVRTNLKWDRPEAYKILADVGPWNYGTATNSYLNVSGALQEVMSKNQDLQIFVASGYYDLATPYFATEYTFNHLGLDPSLRPHVHSKNYEGGHMMYTHIPTLIQMKEDLKEFYKLSE